jgi:hypothetical protein
MDPLLGSTANGMAEHLHNSQPAEQTLEVKANLHNPMARRTYRR